MGVLKVNVGTDAVPDWRKVGCGGAGTVSTVNDTAVRADSATDPNPASDGGVWSVESGTWGVSSNRLYGVSNTPTGTYPAEPGLRTLSTDLGTNAADVTITVARAGTSGGASLIIGYDRVTTSGYQFLFDSSSGFAIVYRKTGPSTRTSLSPSPVMTAWTGGSTVLRMTHDGAGVVALYQNGALKGTWTDPSPLTGGTRVALVEGAGATYWSAFTSNGTAQVVTAATPGRLKLWDGTQWLVECCDGDTGHPLKVNIGTADAPDWVTVACMTPA